MTSMENDKRDSRIEVALLGPNAKGPVWRREEGRKKMRWAERRQSVPDDLLDQFLKPLAFTDTVQALSVFPRQRMVLSHQNSTVTRFNTYKFPLKPLLITLTELSRVSRQAMSGSFRVPASLCGFAPEELSAKPYCHWKREFLCAPEENVKIPPPSGVFDPRFKWRIWLSSTEQAPKVYAPTRRTSAHVSSRKEGESSSPSTHSFLQMPSEMLQFEAEVSSWIVQRYGVLESVCESVCFNTKRNCIEIVEVKSKELANQLEENLKVVFPDWFVWQESNAYSGSENEVLFVFMAQKDED
jgi:hypothetical protein